MVYAGNIVVLKSELDSNSVWMEQLCNFDDDSSCPVPYLQVVSPVTSETPSLIIAFQILGNTLYDFGDVSRAEMMAEVLRPHLQKGSKGVEDAQLLAGRVARMVGNLNQAQHMLEGFLRKSETAYGLEHIRMLPHLYSLNYVQIS